MDFHAEMSSFAHKFRASVFYASTDMQGGTE